MLRGAGGGEPPALDEFWKYVKRFHLGMTSMSTFILSQNPPIFVQILLILKLNEFWNGVRRIYAAFDLVF